MPRDAIAYPTPHRQAQDARILAALAVEPLCDRRLAVVLGMGRTGAAKYAKRLRVEKRIYVCGHRQPLTGGYPRPLYAPGNLPDVEYVAAFPSAPKKAGDRKGDALYRIVKALEKGGTARELGKQCFLSFTTVHKYMDEIHDAGWNIYIKRWKQAGARNAWCPVYASGNKPDAPRPPEKTRAERYAADRADPNKVKRHEDNRRHGRRMAALKQKPAGIFAALGV